MRQWVDLPIPNGLPLSTGTRICQSGPLRAIVSEDAGRWHLSISCADRYPTWDEIADARYDLLPNAIEAAMVLPPAEHYINQHPYTFHLWEMRDPGMPIERFDTGQRRRKDGSCLGY